MTDQETVIDTAAINSLSLENFEMAYTLPLADALNTPGHVQRRMRKITRFEIQDEYDRKQDAAEFEHKQELMLRENRIRQQNLYVKGLISLIILLLAISLFYIRNSRLRATLQENLENRKVLKRIVLHTADNLHIVPVPDIVRAEADSNYTLFLLADGSRIMVSRTIKEYDIMLAGSGMIRVHQSHLVNIVWVDRFVKRDGGYLLLKDKSKIPVSQNLKKKVFQAINDSLYL